MKDSIFNVYAIKDSLNGYGILTGEPAQEKKVLPSHKEEREEERIKTPHAYICLASIPLTTKTGSQGSR